MDFWTRRKRTFKTRPVGRKLVGELNVSQAGIAGFDLNAYQTAHVVMVGAGGIGSNVAQGLVRKGIGTLTLIDDDRVELKNLTRQLFKREDVGALKAVALARNLGAEGLFKTRLVAQPRRLQELLGRSWSPPAGSVLIGGVDNNRARRLLAKIGHDCSLPVIHAAVGRDGNALSVMIQEPGQACWACAFPHLAHDTTAPCGLPGIVDVMQMVAGVIVYAVDTLLSGRHREWNLRQLTLHGGMPDQARLVERRADCPVCGVVDVASPIAAE